MLDKNIIWNEKNYKKFISDLYTKKDSDEFIKFSKKLIFTKYKMIV